MYCDTSAIDILMYYRSCMEDPYTELTIAIIQLRNDIMELTDAVLNLEAALCND